VRTGGIALARAIASAGRDTRVDPAAAGSGAVGAKPLEPVEELLRLEIVAVDLAQHRFHVRLLVRTLGRILPREGVETGVARTIVGGRARLQASPEVVDEPGVAARVPRWIDRLLAPLEQPLGVGEGAFFLGVTRGGD